MIPADRHLKEHDICQRPVSFPNTGCNVYTSVTVAEQVVRNEARKISPSIVQGALANWSSRENYTFLANRTFAL